MADEQFITLGIDALATAHLRFHALAVGAQDTETRDALLLAADVANSLSDLRSAVSEVIIKADSSTFGIADAILELRGALDDTAKVPASPVLTAKGDLLVTFTREGETEHRQVVEGGGRALKVGLLILSLQDELRAGDQLTVTQHKRPTIVEQGIA